MSGILELEELLKSMSPAIQEGEYAFCTLTEVDFDYKHLKPIATFRESEGLTLVLPVDEAAKEGIAFEGAYKQITLTVHSSLEAVGLTAAVANKLTAHGISANVIAAYYHDHIFVQTEKADQALAALKELA